MPRIIQPAKSAHAEPPGAPPDRMPHRAGRRASEPLDFFSLLLWGMLAISLKQAFASSSSWGVAWVALGAVTLIVRRWLPVHLIGVMEAPIFLAILSYSVATLYLASETQAYDLAHDPFLDSTMWLAWAGMACFLAGMVLAFRGRKVRERKNAHVVTVTEREAVLLFFAGMFFSEIILPFVPMSLFVVAFVFGYCAPVGLFIFLALQNRKDLGWVRSWKFGAWVFALAIWSMRSVLGGIFGSTLLILFIFLLQYAHRSKVVLLGILSASLLFAPLMQDTKNDYRHSIALDARSRERTLRDIVMENFDRVFLHGDMNAYRKGITQLAERLCAFDVWFSVKQHMDMHQDFAHGKTIFDALVSAFIPRILWADKPITGGSSELAINYADMNIAEGTSVGVGTISEFYINGGTFWVLIGMAALGFLGGRILKFGWSDRVQPLGLILSIFTFAQMVRPETNFSDVLGGVIRMVFLWGVIRFWIVRRHHQQHVLAARRAALRKHL